MWPERPIGQGNVPVPSELGLGEVHVGECPVLRSPRQTRRHRARARGSQGRSDVARALTDLDADDDLRLILDLDLLRS